MTCSWWWFIHPETAISTNRNGSSTPCVFKTHYLDCGAAVAKYRIFMQIQFSDHTGFVAVFITLSPRPPRGLARPRQRAGYWHYRACA